MVFIRCTRRFFNIYRTCYASDKSLLATLRKKTGYTFANCKKALELNNNDVTKAEKWLQEQAQAMGWSKATKLEGRTTKQGLVGIGLQFNNAAIVEVNCETDFVARNDSFKNMVSDTVRACLRYCELHGNQRPLSKLSLDAQQLKQLPGLSGRSLGDELALVIGTVGENATLRRALLMQANDGVKIAGYVHPSGKEINGVSVGRFGALLAVQNITDNASDVGEVAKLICQHVVGMNPLKIGTETDQRAEDIDDEKCLIHQEFLNDNRLLVKDVLEENGIEVIDFKRFECGEIETEELAEESRNPIRY